MKWLRHRRGDERGSVLVLTALVMVVFLGMAAILVDLGNLRAASRVDQSIVDFAALAAGRKLGINQPAAACQDAITYLNANAGLTSAINASTFCSQGGNAIGSTTCSGGLLNQATPSTTVGRYTVSVHYPVPAEEIRDPNFGGGPGINDGLLCQRMRVIVTTEDKTLFGAVFGKASLSTTRSATVRPNPVRRGLTPALWLLDPVGCTPLSVSGGSQLTLGAVTPDVIAGVMSVDSDGSACASNQVTVSASGAGTLLTAVPSQLGTIQLYALPDAATVCSAPACDPADVSGGRLVPQPVKASERATRALVDWVYNCKATYPDYHGIAIAPCPSAPTTPAYVDLLRVAIGTAGVPSGSFQRWTTAYPCNPSTTIVATGNWWVDCSTFSIGNGSDVAFSGGNVVFDGGLNMTGGSLTFNNTNPNSTLPGICAAPMVTTPCTASSSDGATFAYVRSGDWNVTGGIVDLQHTFLYLHTGYLKIAGGAPPRLRAPIEGPFAGLGLWAETASNKFQINGGAGVTLSGAFFTPEAAPFSLGGGGVWGQQNAQFISYRMTISGGSILSMAPDPTTGVQAPIRAGVLIR